MISTTYQEDSMAPSPTAPKLFPADLQMALEDARHLGFGYAASQHIEVAAVREKLDAAVVARANLLGLDSEQLFQWTNSKYGRWLCDEVGDSPDRVTDAIVRRYLNSEVMRVLAEGR